MDSILFIDTGLGGRLLCSPVKNTASTTRPQAVAIIPARFHSTRLPGKPLSEISGRPMILWVAERALAASNISRAIVATDDERIVEAVSRGGFEAVMTSPAHQSGSDRLAEVASTLEDVNVIVNVQGDEPLISPRTIERVVDELINTDEAQIVTTCEMIEDAADVISPDVVKVVRDKGGRALYFSRSPVPYPREAVRTHGSLSAALEREPQLLKLFRRHTGLYAYRRSFLLEYAGWPQTGLEHAEALEQLRALERGATILVVEADSPSIGVDTPEDLERVRALLANKPFS